MTLEDEHEKLSMISNRMIKKYIKRLYPKPPKYFYEMAGSSIIKYNVIKSYISSEYITNLDADFANCHADYKVQYSIKVNLKMILNILKQDPKIKENIMYFYENTTALTYTADEISAEDLHNNVQLNRPLK